MTVGPTCKYCNHQLAGRNIKRSYEVVNAATVIGEKQKLAHCNKVTIIDGLPARFSLNNIISFVIWVKRSLGTKSPRIPVYDSWNRIWQEIKIYQVCIPYMCSFLWSCFVEGTGPHSCTTPKYCRVESVLPRHLHIFYKFVTIIIKLLLRFHYFTSL